MNWIERKGPQALLIWGVLVVALSLSASMGGDIPRVTGDDAMRLVTAMDLFHGQSWFDTIQHRDNTPFGAPMHWSRLIDAPLVLLMAVFQPFAQDAAPYWAAFVWPLFVLLVVVALLAELTERVAGKAARFPALALLALSIAVYTEFIPGRVDHHNVQIALTLAMIILSIEGRLSTRAAIGAGVVAATGIAIGTEILPATVAVLVCFGLYWVVEPQRCGTRLLAFAASFAAGLLLHVLASAPPQLWFVAACDALSITYVVAGAAYGLAILIAVLLGAVLRHWALRFGALAVLGALAITIVVISFPECLAGPYGNLDPDLARILMTQISEAQPLFAWVYENPQFAALVVTPVLGLAAMLLATALAPHDQRWRWIVLSGFCLALFAVFCLQVRGFRLLTIAVLPGLAWIAAQLWAWFRSRQTLLAAAVTGLTLLSFTGVAHYWVAYNLVQALSSDAGPSEALVNWDACLQREDYEPLAELPTGTAMSFLLIGAQILLETPHSIVSAGYHRNEDGLRDMVRFYGGGEAEARAVAEQRGLDYLVFCRGLPPNGGLEGVPAFEGLDWPWLEPISDPDADLQIYAIDLPPN